jgi:hypothetical protein
MGPDESKSYQLRVRVTAEERDLLKHLRIERGRGETVSDLVREAISGLVKASPEGKFNSLSPKVQHQLERLAVLLKREPLQVPLIVMETHLHLKYRNRDERPDFPWNLNQAESEEQQQAPPAESNPDP